MQADWSIDVLSVLVAGVRDTATLVSLRAFPFVVAFVGSVGSAVWQRAVVGGAYLAFSLFVSRTGLSDGVDVVAAYAYLSTVALVPFVAHRIGCGRFAVFMVSALVFLLIPSVCLPRGQIAMLLGWDMMLAAYSFCADDGEKKEGIGRYAFFVLVNPALVYSRRGEIVSAAGFNRMGFARVGTGLLAITCSRTIVRWLPMLLSVANWPGMAFASLVKLIGIYAAHWGLASLQIGLMRQLGIKLPERYIQPYKATSPRDFWRRWNTYVATWARIYLFIPFATFMAQRLRGRWRRDVIHAVGILVTFIGVGLLHELYSDLCEHRASGVVLAWFVVCACVLLVWEWLIRLRSTTVVGRPVLIVVARLGVLGVALTLVSQLPN